MLIIIMALYLQLWPWPSLIPGSGCPVLPCTLPLLTLTRNQSLMPSPALTVGESSLGDTGHQSTNVTTGRFISRYSCILVTSATESSLTTILGKDIRRYAGWRSVMQLMRNDDDVILDFQYFSRTPHMLNLSVKIRVIQTFRHGNVLDKVNLLLLCMTKM